MTFEVFHFVGTLAILTLMPYLYNVIVVITHAYFVFWWLHLSRMICVNFAVSTSISEISFFIQEILVD